MTQREELEEFQKLHGQKLAQIFGMPAFNAAMIHLTIQVTEGIKRLDDRQIREDSVIILSDLRGRLRHEAELIKLATIPDLTFTDDLQPDYPNPEAELLAEKEREKNT